MSRLTRDTGVAPFSRSSLPCAVVRCRPPSLPRLLRPTSVRRRAVRGEADAARADPIGDVGHAVLARLQALHEVIYLLLERVVRHVP